MSPSLISQGVDLMLYGMGTVFIFLTLLVLVTTVMSKVIGRLTLQPQVQPITESVDSSPTINSNHKLAIAEAIKQHRQRR